ncbi:MAG: VOC family protein [Myxococcota bacterium]
MGLELDHIFVLVPPEDARATGRAGRALAGAGLVPSYERRHLGQGTANVCYCFDNAFLELLFVVAPSELARPEVRRTGLRERFGGGCPFGIAVRGGPPPFPTWEYRFEALPPGLTIPVTTESTDLEQPFLFSFPGTKRPDAWTDGRAGERQAAAGFREIEGLELRIPTAGNGVRALAATGLLAVAEGEPELRLRLSHRSGNVTTLVLPDFQWE